MGQHEFDADARELQQIVEAQADGRVEALFARGADERVEQSGKAEPIPGASDSRGAFQGNVDLVGRAILLDLGHGGTSDFHEVEVFGAQDNLHLQEAGDFVQSVRQPSQRREMFIAGLQFGMAVLKSLVFRQILEVGAHGGHGS